jgi:glyoxylase-like metal-dependent hydrolase (beta-lactamase superfamily II)
MSEAKVREVWPGIYVIHLPLPMRPTIINVYLLHSRDEWALVDTGVNTAESIATFDAALKEVGCAPDKITKVICTHHHPDHFGSSRTYQERFGASVYMSRLEYEISQAFMHRGRSDDVTMFFIRNGFPLDRFVQIPSPGEFWSELYAPAVPDHFMVDGEVFSVGDLEVEVITTPGHTPEHCVLYVRRQRLMIAGDHLLPKITPHVGIYPGGPDNPLRDFLESQRKIQRFDVNMVLPAHGGTFMDHRHRANQIIQHHEYRIQEMLDAVRRRPRTAYEVASLAFGFDTDSPIMVQFPATFETLAHLEYMRSLGQVAREERGERVFYRAAQS